ncbi:MAG TPA: hypothetical protein VHX62_02615 [Solirubrobacteraceae bacterium]|nr:hypothetical protein [Solirubrobacteraceae bacterium]
MSIIVVAAIGYGVSKLQSSSYSASSTVVVSSVPGAVQAGTAADSASLAATYQAALPSDSQLHAYVAHTAHAPVTGSSITALPSSGAVVRLQFTAHSARAALAGARAIAGAVSGKHPSVSAVTPSTLNVTGVSSTPKHRHHRYHAVATLAIPAASGPTEGINPDDAQHLATTYAALLTSDQKLLSAVSGATGLHSSTVGSDLSVVNTQNTSILQITFRASDPRTAAIGATKMARLVSGPNPVGAGIIPASIALVSTPPTPSSATTATSSAKPVAIGALLGLLLGIVLLVAWERSDPRISDARSLSSQLGCPATPGERLSPDAARALLERWRSLTDAVPARVAILAADRSTAADAQVLIDSLVAAGNGEVSSFDARSGLLPEQLNGNGNGNSRVGVVLVNPGPADSDGPGEAVALSCDLTVAVVRKGARVTEVRELAQELGNFGIVPTWALLSRPGQPVAADVQRVPERVVSA